MVPISKAINVLNAMNKEKHTYKNYFYFVDLLLY